jgi:chromosome segregation ATPase
MRIDDLPEQFATFAERAEAVLKYEVEKVKKVTVALNAERAAAEKALGEIKDQHAATKKQLDDVLKDLDRASGLAGLNNDIAETKKTLKVLEADKAKAETALEATQTKLKDTERELNEADGAMRRLRAERTEATTHIDHIRHLLKSVA